MTPWVLRLLAANVAIFFVQSTLPGLVDGFAFFPMYALYRPWTFVTYMFLHGGIGHLFANMLGLYFFGSRVEERLGSKRFLTLYFLAGICGALLTFLLAPRAAVIGASGGVLGVMFAFAYFWPRAQIYIWGILPVEAWLLVSITGVLAIVSGFGGSRGGVADFAHLGGLAGAFIYLKWIERNAGARKFRVQAAPRVEEKSLANWRKVDPRSVHEVNRDELNRVLDKIGKSGLASLTPQERAFLSSFVPPDDRVPPPT